MSSLHINTETTEVERQSLDMRTIIDRTAFSQTLSHKVPLKTPAASAEDHPASSESDSGSSDTSVTQRSGDVSLCTDRV